MWEAAFGVAPIFGDLEQRLWQLFERGSANTYGASSLAVATLAASASSGIAPGLGQQQIEGVDIMQLAVRDVDEARNIAAQIDQCVHQIGRAHV